MDKLFKEALNKFRKKGRKVYIDPLLSRKHSNLGYTALRLRTGDISEHGELKHESFFGRVASEDAVRRLATPALPILW